MISYKCIASEYQLNKFARLRIISFRGYILFRWLSLVPRNPSLSRNIYKLIKSNLNRRISASEKCLDGSCSSIIFNELLAKLKNKWHFPVDKKVICPCLNISTKAVDHAIIQKASSLHEVRAQTKVAVRCAYCIDDVNTIINFRRREDSLS